MVDIPSPAIAVVGRHNSGKTTLVTKLISELAARGLDVGSVKHHTHGDFEIDYPGKDSYRHREAGATETVIASPNKMARVRTLHAEVECSKIVRSMPGHDIVIVEGYRKSGLPTIEVMRAANERDAAVAEEFARTADAKSDTPLSDKSSKIQSDASGLADGPSVADDIAEKMPDAAQTVAVVTDIPIAAHAAEKLGIPAFGLEDIAEICDFLQERYTRPAVSIVIQAGGESRRMGQSKALVEFCGRPLICRIIERLRDAGDELIITTNEGEKLSFLHEMYPMLNLRLVSDRCKERGALRGLYTALSAALHDVVAVVACDMVFASAPLVVAETTEMAATGADVVVPVNKHGFEPFHATYRASVCVPAIERALDAGDTRAQAIFDDPEVEVDKFPHRRVLEVEPMGGCFVNTNTPEELRRIEDDLLED